MAGSFKKAFSNLRREISKDVNKITKEVAEIAQKDLVKFHRSIIDDFYNAYEPGSYKRHHGLYNTIFNNGIEPQGKHGFVASITMKPPTGFYRGGADVVLDLMWNKGVRGLPHHGNKPLNHTFYYWAGRDEEARLVNWGFEGQQWHNPYWDPEKYKNTFQTPLAGGLNVPNIAMIKFMNRWGKHVGRNACDRIVQKIR